VNPKQLNEYAALVRSIHAEVHQMDQRLRLVTYRLLGALYAEYPVNKASKRKRLARQRRAG